MKRKLRNSLIIKNILIHFSLNPKIQLLTFNFQPFKFGLVLNPKDSVESLVKNHALFKLEAVQIMSVNPGFQGSVFIPETLTKIQQLRQLGYRKSILLDGGINDKSLPQILELKYKPDILTIGSFLTKANNLSKKITYLKSLAVV